MFPAETGGAAFVDYDEADYNESATNARQGPPASFLKCPTCIWVPLRRKNAQLSLASE
jgi:hypothetical protein